LAIVLATACLAQLFWPQPVVNIEILRIFAATSFVLSIFALDSGAATSVERSVSPSGQFIIYGGDAAWRGAVSALAERTKANLLAVLRRRDQWVTAAVINLQPRAANLPEIPAAALRFSQTGSGLKLQLDLTISGEMNLGAMERELLRVILLEMIYRNQTAIPSGEAYVEAPDWLVEGLLALTPNRDCLLLVNALAVSERITPLDEFLRERPELLDSAGRLFYRAYSFALVQLVVESADGRARLGSYINNLAFASNDLLADLQAAFPQLAGNDLGKIWESMIASMKRSARTHLLTFRRQTKSSISCYRQNFRLPMVAINLCRSKVFAKKSRLRCSEWRSENSLRSSCCSLPTPTRSFGRSFRIISSLLRSSHSEKVARLGRD